jgi:hypothetical protein
MTPEEDATLREARSRFEAQGWTTKWLRTELEQSERRRATGGPIDEADLAAKRTELAAAEARTAALDRDVGRASVPGLRASLASVRDVQAAAAGAVVWLREVWDKADPARAAEAEAQLTSLLPTLRTAADVEREVLALLAKFEAPDGPREAPEEDAQTGGQGG